MTSTALVVPSPRALLPPVSQVDPVAGLRAACAAAVAALPEGEVVVVAAPVSAANAARGAAEPLGHRVARHLLDDRPFVPVLAGDRLPPHDVLMVVADGSARRHEKAPGHLHAEAVPFDDRVEKALRTGDADALAALDPDLGEELWCEGIPGLRVLGEVAAGRPVTPVVTYAEAPYGVAWWVARWDLG